MPRFNNMPDLAALFRCLTALGFSLPLLATVLLATGTTAQEPDVQEPAESSQEKGEAPNTESERETATGETAPETPRDEEVTLEQFTPSEQIRADSEVTFPADI